MQNYIIYVILAAAIFYVARKAYRSMSGKGGCGCGGSSGGCGGCGSSHSTHSGGCCSNKGNDVKTEGKE